MSIMQAVKITPVTPALGARVDGLDAREPLDDATVTELQSAIDKYKVLFLVDQHLDEDQHARLAGYFGEPFEGSNRVEKEYEQLGLTDVSVVSHFHSDLMYMDEQPTYAMLQMLELPPEGGDTMWADLTAAYDGLSEPIRTLIDGLSAFNGHPDYYVSDDERSARYERSFGRPLTADELAFQKRILTPHSHPVVRRIPETGLKNFWVSAQHTMHIEGVSRPESDAILKLLFAQALRPEYVIRWRWTLGDIAFWDHRTTLHAGVNDYDGPRRGRRANIKRATPIPANG